MKIDLTPTDRVILARHDPSVRGRAMIELAIVDALIQTAQDHLFYLEIEGDGEDKASSTRRVDGERFKAALFNLDDVQLSVYNGVAYKGWIRLVFGNDGYDLISDDSVNLEEFLSSGPIEKVARMWGN
jgi:hypothetical protein